MLSAFDRPIKRALAIAFFGSKKDHNPGHEIRWGQDIEEVPISNKCIPFVVEKAGSPADAATSNPYAHHSRAELPALAIPKPAVVAELHSNTTYTAPTYESAAPRTFWENGVQYVVTPIPASSAQQAVELPGNRFNQEAVELPSRGPIQHPVELPGNKYGQ
jgi:hypothetical protein